MKGVNVILNLIWFSSFICENLLISGLVKRKFGFLQIDLCWGEKNIVKLIGENELREENTEQDDVPSNKMLTRKSRINFIRSWMWKGFCNQGTFGETSNAT